MPTPGAVFEETPDTPGPATHLDVDVQHPRHPAYLGGSVVADTGPRGGSSHCWRLRMVSFKKEHCVIAPRMESCCMGFVILGLGNHSKHVQVKRLELTESFPPDLTQRFPTSRSTCSSLSHAFCLFFSACISPHLPIPRGFGTRGLVAWYAIGSLVPNLQFKVEVEDTCWRKNRGARQHIP